MFNIRSTKLTVSATKPTATSCQIQVVAICCQNQQQSWPYRQQSRPQQAVKFKLLPFVAKTSNKVDRIGISRLFADLLLVSATVKPATATVDFQQSRPCWIQPCCQCVPGFASYQWQQKEHLTTVALVLQKITPIHRWAHPSHQLLLKSISHR